MDQRSISQMQLSGQKSEAKEEARDEESKTSTGKVSKVLIILGSAVVVCCVVLVLICVFLIKPEDNSTYYWLPTAESNSRLGVYKKAAVATDAAPCAPIGREILFRNGSAVDAAIAMLVCMGAVHPVSQGLGGGFFMTVYQKSSEKAYSVDAREVAPLDAYADMFQGNPELSKYGGLAIAVPGELAGYAAAHEKFGKLPWEELFLPTVELCRKGIIVTRYLAKHLAAQWSRIEQRRLLRDFFTNNATGEPFKAKEIMYCHTLADTLETIARDGKSALYDPTRHPLAASFLKDIKDMGSIIKEEDMQGYQSKISEPLKTKLRINNATVFTPPVPASGALLIFMLNVLSGYNISKIDVRTEEAAMLLIHRIVETFKYTYAHRMNLEDKPTVLPLIRNLTSKAYADAVRFLINDNRTYEDVRHYFDADVKMAKDDHGTAHASVIDSNGNAVSVTSTINLYFGAMEMSPSTGIILNNEMDDFSVPKVMSYFDVPPSNYNMIEPLKRPLSSMCPTIVINNNNDVKLVLGGAGGTKITTGVLQVILRNMFLHEDIKKAIDAPRFHHQLLPNVLQLESNFPKKLSNNLLKMGHNITNLEGERMLAIITGIARKKNGDLYANADFRKGGDVAGF